MELKKSARAVETAEKLSGNNIWKSYGRPIGIDTLTNELKLKIIDYEKDEELNEIIGEYYDVLKEYMSGHGYNGFFQTRLFI